MATYVELHSIRGASSLVPLRQKISIALCIKANLLAKLPTPTEAQKAFAKATFQSPEVYVDTALNYILAGYNTATLVAITDATDAAVQTAVNAAVDTLLGI